MVSFINKLKSECSIQYQQFKNQNNDDDKLFFFCFPKFEEKMENMSDFPDPKKYLFGFFIAPVDKKRNISSFVDLGSEQEVPLSQSVSSYTSKYQRDGSDLGMNNTLRKRVNPQYLSITISDIKENESSSFLTNNCDKPPQFNTLPDESVPKISAAAVKSEEEPKPNDIQPPLQKPKVIMQENKYEIIRNKACKTSKEKKITEEK